MCVCDAIVGGERGARSNGRREKRDEKRPTAGWTEQGVEGKKAERHGTRHEWRPTHDPTYVEINDKNAESNTTICDNKWRINNNTLTGARPSMRGVSQKKNKRNLMRCDVKESKREVRSFSFFYLDKSGFQSETGGNSPSSKRSKLVTSSFDATVGV